MAAPTPSIGSTCGWSAELAWHNLFIRHLLRRPERARSLTASCRIHDHQLPELQGRPGKSRLPQETVIALNFDKKLILIGNTEYAGENKKSVFTLLNYLLPEKGVMAMHCSANHANGNPDDTAVFFGLSGTGKTTLSADPGAHADRRRRTWLVRPRHLQLRGRLLRQDHQPPRGGRAGDLRHDPKFGTVIENMVYDPETLELDFDDDSLTANMRCAYPLEQISERLRRGSRASEEHRHADLRRLRRAAADRAADAGAGDVSLPVGLHLQGRRHRARRDRARAHILHLLRRALHAAPARGLRPTPAGQDPRSTARPAGW
jgi:hypothetical protein